MAGTVLLGAMLKSTSMTLAVGLAAAGPLEVANDGISVSHKYRLGWSILTVSGRVGEVLESRR